MSEIEMHYGEALAWIRELEAFIVENGLTVPTWADRDKVGLQPKPEPLDALPPGIVSARAQRAAGIYMR
jgi:hypothetical protein